MTRRFGTGWLPQVGLLTLMAAIWLSTAHAADPLPAPETYLLRYRFEPGETIRWKVLHLGTTETTVRGTTQTSRCRTLSMKVWQVTDVTADATATFSHTIAWVDASNKVSEHAEVRYNSRTDAIPPDEFAGLAPTIGKTLSTVTVTPRGQVQEKDSKGASFDMGLGEILIPFPEDAVAVGSSWHVPDEIRITRRDKTIERIKIRKTFTLSKVVDGVADLMVKTEILTPISDPQTKVQMLQKIPDGSIRFDLAQGRVVYRQMDWKETVVGFDGQDGMMQYLARFTEELLGDDESVTDPILPAGAEPTAPVDADIAPDTPKTAAKPSFGPALPPLDTGVKTADLNGLQGPSNEKPR